MTLTPHTLGTPHTREEEPGIRAALTRNGLGQASHVLTGWIQSRLSTIHLPEVQGEVDIGIGAVYYVLHDMSVVQCDLPEPEVAPTEGTGISVLVSGVSIKIQGSWNTNFGIIHDGGWFELAVFDILLKSTLQLGSDYGARLSVTALFCQAEVGNVDINFHGGASFIFQPFVSHFTGRIISEIQVKICPAFNQAVESLESHLAAMEVSIPVSPFVFVKIPLTESPIVTDSGIEVDIKGIFYSIQNPTEPPFPPNHFALQWQDDCMLAAGASEFCVNTVAFAHFTAGALQINITDSMIPKTSPVHLNTSQFGPFIPQLPKLFPNRLMQVLLYASESPHVSLRTNMIIVEVSAEAKVFAVQPDSSLAPLFKLDMEISLSGKVFIEGQLLKGSLTLNNFTMTLGSSEIGQFEIGVMQNTMKTALNMVVLPQLNGKLRDGLPLPSPKGFSLANAKLTVGEGFLALTTDIEAPYEDKL
ncbi:bactericidal permeability-increasing protein-like [Chanos chanos]|uniref:Bactericidal permeability-increasing protein n=1 Tax=Chanos chanos TaxID=29144 RepID=A0A6J2WCP1_CHACN|nr:bactericidal permeability-increasing protein-like [Chanos chanos]